MDMKSLFMMDMKSLLIMDMKPLWQQYISTSPPPHDNPLTEPLTCTTSSPVVGKLNPVGKSAHLRHILSFCGEVLQAAHHGVRQSSIQKRILLRRGARNHSAIFWVPGFRSLRDILGTWFGFIFVFLWLVNFLWSGTRFFVCL
jgi:hypothetical protein